MQRNVQAALLVACALLACVHFAQAAEPSATAEAGKVLSDTAANVNKVSDAFMKLLSNPYDLSGLMLPNEFSINRAGVSPEAVKAASDMRAKLRQSLSDVVNVAVDRTSEFVKAAEAELAKSGKGGNELLQRLSAIPLKFDGQGNTMVNNPLTAIGAFLVNTVQQQLKAAKEAAGPDMDKQLGQSMAGRKLLQEMDAFEAAFAEGDEELIDFTQPAHPKGPAAVARQMDRMMNFITALTDVADDIMGHLEEAQKVQKEAENEGDEEEVDSEDAASRKLQQALLPDPNGGYAKAAVILFSNIFDFFRGNGLYGLTPLLADLRGVLTRFNFLADLLNILDAPLENFINANYFPLPQSNDDFIKLVQKFSSDYCKLEKATSSETVLGEFEGPSVSYEVKPVNCPIYTDPDNGRNYVSFPDCEPATLTIKVNPLTITEAYFSAAEYSGTECKYVEPYGTDLAINLGGGEATFSFVRSAKGIDIVPQVIQIGGKARFHPFNPPDAQPDSNLPPPNAAVGNGFTVTNLGANQGGTPPALIGLTGK